MLILPPPGERQRRERKARTGPPPSLPVYQRDSLEKPPRPYVAGYLVYAGDGHLIMDLGVDGSPVAHGYADVGDVSAAVLAPEEQVSGLGSTVDRGPVAHL